MGRDRIRRGSPEHQAIQARRAAEQFRWNNERKQAEMARNSLVFALSQGGQEAYAVWKRERAHLVGAGMLARDVLVVPLAWVPEPLPTPDREELPDVPLALDALKLAVELLERDTPMLREDHVTAQVYVARLRHLLGKGYREES